MEQNYENVFDTMMLNHFLIERDVFVVREDLTKQQEIVLAGIAMFEPVGSGALADFLSLPPQNVSRNVIDLESQGLVTRTVDPENRRQVILTISDRGRDFISSHRKNVNMRLDVSLGGLSEDERALLVDVSRVAKNLLRKALEASTR